MPRPSLTKLPDSRPLTIVVLGGAERLAASLVATAEQRGHRLEYHHGHPNARGLSTLLGAMSRADVVVIVTGVNSHGAVHFARDHVRKNGIASLIAKSFGTAHLSRLLDALEHRSMHAANDQESVRSAVAGSHLGVAYGVRASA